MAKQFDAFFALPGVTPHHRAAIPSSMTDLRAEVIVFQILTWVPAKEVGRSKTVCKEWCALLSTRYFVRVDSS
ncbi:putative F-box-like domain superfamily protein [Helianthus anomalus]